MTKQSNALTVQFTMVEFLGTRAGKQLRVQYSNNHEPHDMALSQELPPCL